MSVLFITIFGGCKAELGLPRVDSRFTAPSGGFVAEVRNHVSIDPPEQSLWVGPVGGRLVRVAGVASDTTWDGPCAWSLDSSAFAFMVGDELNVVTSRGEGILVRHRLTQVVEGGDREIRDLVVSTDSGEMSLVLCGTSNGSCVPYKIGPATSARPST